MPVFWGTAAADAILGSAGADEIYGRDGDDALYGGDGDDLLVGGRGNDGMVGGKGDDVYDVDAASDRIVEQAGEGVDGVRAWVSYRLAGNVENLTLVGPEDLDGVGNALDNRIGGNAGANLLYGLAGSDLLSGGAGNDRLFGGDGIDYLYGGDGSDVVDGGAGIDRMEGGAGDDTYEVDSAGDRVVEEAGKGIDGVRGWVSYRLTENVENLLLLGTSDLDGVGNAVDNRIIGNGGANLLYGLAGNDVLSGGAGNDRLLGADGIDYLYGGAGNDELDGGIGADLMDGGKGNDSYEVDSAGDRVVELVAEGIDSVRSWVSYRLGTYVENLTLLGTGDLDGIGNARNNSITGNAGNNVLDGGEGEDILVGGQGNDIYYIDAFIDQVVEQTSGGIDEIRIRNDGFTIALPDAIENVRLLTNGGADAYGNGQGNGMVGGGWRNMLSGLAGNDVLMGEGGDDTLYGGIGRDQLYGGSGNDELNVGEDLALDARNGIAAGEVYDGGAGTDELRVVQYDLSGGGGVDLSSIDISKINISNIENIESHFHTTKLSAAQMSSFEEVRANEIDITNGGYVDISSMNVQFNWINLSSFGNTLILGPGPFGSINFGISCGAGDDILVGANSYGTIHGEGGDDEITGGTVDNQFFGDSGDDILRGEGGNDVLGGGEGNDRLVGGAGEDEFAFYSVNSGIDIIADFKSAQDDKLAFSNLLHGTFSYLGSAAFTAGGNSEARFAGGQVLVDTDGSGSVDIVINLTGITAASELHASDFIFS
ncbi:Ca2+-binding RTX toxin-like protein [Inquilinus ginsengisoli]|uniref:calcium-binding protein n=1 Tax=Inquilinus ginsengisoli TaxID=363840 RepID=UPI003D263D82